MTDLDKLIEAVEAGDNVAVQIHAKRMASDARDRGLPCWPAYDIEKAMSRNDLNAALALHESLLPGWTVRLCAFTPHGNSAPHVHVFKMRRTEDDPIMSGNSSGYSGGSPARAWLLAILRAYRSTQGEAG